MTSTAGPEAATRLGASTSVAKLVGATAEAANGLVNDPPRSERDGYFDLGVQLYGSGLRKDGDVPNGGKDAAYAQVNLSASHAFDEKHLIRDGSGVGVGALQYGPRRGVFVGVSKTF